MTTDRENQIRRQTFNEEMELPDLDGSMSCQQLSDGSHTSSEADSFVNTEGKSVLVNEANLSSII